MDLHYCKHSARTWKILLVVLAGHTLISMEAYAQTGCPPGGSTSPHVIGQWDDNLIGPFFPTKRCSGGPLERVMDFLRVSRCLVYGKEALPERRQG